MPYTIAIIRPLDIQNRLALSSFVIDPQNKPFKYILDIITVLLFSHNLIISLLRYTVISYIATGYLFRKVNLLHNVKS